MRVAKVDAAGVGHQAVEEANSIGVREAAGRRG
jgi:hypothetical protein